MRGRIHFRPYLLIGGAVWLVATVAIGAWWWTLLRDRHETRFDGSDRTYLLHVPDDLPPGAPLVLGLHGYTDRPEFTRRYSHMDDLADEYGFAVAYPQGTRTPFGLTFWNADLDLGREPDDLGFLVWLADELTDEYDLDRDRVYVFGLSNGGFMAYHLACDAADEFAGVASVVGTMSGADWETCDPAEPIPVLQIHGTADPIVPDDGSLTSFGGWGGAPPIAEVVEWWAERDGTTGVETETVGDTTITRYIGGDDGTEVWFHRIDGFGHGWPGASTGTDASRVIVDFFGLDESTTRSG